MTIIHIILFIGTFVLLSLQVNLPFVDEVITHMNEFLHLVSESPLILISNVLHQDSDYGGLGVDNTKECAIQANSPVNTSCVVRPTRGS